MEEGIPFEQLPGITKVFQDYIHRYESVRGYYSEGYRDSLHWTGISDRISKRKYERLKISELLREQNVGFNSGEKTFENIELFKDSNTLAVFTGQQIGLYSGPLYTLYKALTACKLAQILNHQSSITNHKFVPFFWMESDDHNIREVNHISMLNRENQITQLKVEMEEGRMPAGSISMKGRIEKSLESLEGMEIDSEYKEEVFEVLKSAYLSSENFAQGFGRMMATLFKEYGLVLINPLDSRWKEIAHSFYKRVIEKNQEIKILLREQSERLLKNGYHNQIQGYSQSSEGMRETLEIFLLRNGERLPLRIVNDELRIENSEIPLRNSELQFSPNVALRPILQDWLFPTILYVAGPSEIAYYAQLKPLYELFGVEMPVIFPRASITLVEKGIAKVLEKYNLSIPDFFANPDSVIQKILSEMREGNSPPAKNAEEIFVNLEKSLSQSFSGLEGELVQVDPSLKGAIENSQKKILYQLGKLRNGLHEGEKKRNEILVRQIERASNHLFPNGKLQEREFNIVHYLVRYGMNFLTRIEREIDPFRFEHRVVYL